MRISEVPFAVLRFHYQLARFPLQVIEDRVVTRIPTEAPARLLFERSLGMLDTTVGNVLDDPKLVKRGTALVERSDALSRAAQLDAKAAARKEQADAKLRSARDEAIEDRQEAQAATQQEIAEARNAAEQRKREAAQSAQQQSAAAKRRADEAADRQKRTVESAKRQVETRTQAAEKAASEVAAVKIDEAEDKLGDAAEKRSEADRVAQLAAAEKRQRQEERAND
ncbi:IF2 family translation initiation factor [Mycobacterium paraffinicum]|uniref:IF2 family translation initiation factor n=1 Tax=Mycobacterium paraffinicum TaxID=53378 RepID=A0ABP8RDL6_9MYCO|nr:IF2 family translation initiation factor [Mycobacterium paraffinicum]MCV7313795.1 IF2 family translation initiation factor [Mycobacterium paraffinicum]